MSAFGGLRFHRCAAFLILTVLFFDSGRVGKAAGKSSDSDALNASIVALIANPMTYNGRVVRTEGFLCITSQDEGDALYLHEEDLRFAIDANSVSLDLTPDQKKRFQMASQRHVLLEGTFHANARGALQAGSINHVRRLEIWDAKAESGSYDASQEASCPVAINPTVL